MSILGITTTLLATRISEAIQLDELDPDGFDISGGLYGVAFSNVIRDIAIELDKPTIDYICQKQWLWVDSVGWHNKTPLEALALIASEVGECVNECRGKNPTEALGEELADICLRVFDLAQDLNIDLQQKIVNKMEKNKSNGTRGRRV